MKTLFYQLLQWYTPAYLLKQMLNHYETNDSALALFFELTFEEKPPNLLRFPPEQNIKNFPKKNSNSFRYSWMLFKQFPVYGSVCMCLYLKQIK